MSSQFVDTNMNNALINDSLELEEFVVTGQYNPQSIKHSVFKIYVLDQEKIQAKGASNVQQILNTELGIQFSNDMALGVSDIGLMGMSGRNLKILLDGIPMLDRGDVRESLNQLDITQIDKIEIVEGPMSIVYGTDALAGVINIITKKTQSSTWSVNARIQEESVGKEYSPFGNKGLHSRFISGQWDDGNWNFLLSMSNYDFKGFLGDEYNRNHSWKPKIQWIPSAKIGYRNARFNIYYRPDYLNETIYTKGPINLDTYKGSNKKFITKKHSHQLQSNYEISDKVNVNFSSSLTDYKRITETFIKNFVTQEEFLSTGQGEQDIAKFTSTNLRSTLQYKVNRHFSIQPGLEFNYEKASSDRISGQPSYTDISAFLSAEFSPIEKIKIRPGIRMTKNSLYDAPPIIPSVNLLYNLNNKYSLRLSYARGYRAPALRELYFDFVDANHNLKGNPDLKAENSQSLNGSIDYVHFLQNNISINSEFGAFYNVFDNLISIASNPSDPTQFINVNISEFSNTGASWRNKIKVNNWDISFNMLMLGQNNNLKDISNLLPNEKIPLFAWSPEISIEFGFNIPKVNTKLAVFYKYVGSREMYNYTIDAEDNYELMVGKMQDFHIMDVSVSQRINSQIILQLGARNLFDIVNVLNTGVQTGGSHSSGGSTPFGYGRSYFLNLSYSFHKNFY